MEKNPTALLNEEKRVTDAIEPKVPDRVPMIPPCYFLPVCP
jgi:hypothetical protein